MSTLNRAFRHLLGYAQPQPKREPSGEGIGAAFAHRAIGLTTWLRGDTARMEREMLASAEMFLALGNLHETAVSQTLLGICLAERSPALALALVEAGLDEMDDGFWLRSFAETVRAECLLTLERRGKPRSRLQELRYRETADACGDLRVHWLAWRSCGRLGDQVAGVALAGIGMCLLAEGSYEEAILCAADLAELAALCPADEVGWLIAGVLLEACENRIGLTGPFSTALFALRLLHSEISSGVPFPEAVRPLYRVIPDLYRFPHSRLPSLVPGLRPGDLHGSSTEALHACD